MKRCVDCGEEKALTEFARAKQCKNGVRNFCKKCASRKASEWNKNNPHRVREIEARRRRKKYGIDLELPSEVICEVCGSDQNVCVDHDHSCCGKNKACERCIRGRLCRPCNLALGLLNDSPELVMKMYDYLNK